MNKLSKLLLFFAGFGLCALTSPALLAGLFSKATEKAAKALEEEAEKLAEDAATKAAAGAEDITITTAEEVTEGGMSGTKKAAIAAGIGAGAIGAGVIGYEIFSDDDDEEMETAAPSSTAAKK